MPENKIELSERVNKRVSIGKTRGKKTGVEEGMYSMRYID